MPLPDAKPAPSKANIYEQFSSIKASDLTRSQLDIIRDPLFLNSESEDVLRRIKLIGQVTDQLSTSGPIPRTATLSQVTTSSASDSDTILFRPGVGEVWRFNGGDILRGSGLGTFSANFKLKDNDDNVAFIGSASSTGQETIPSDNWGLRIPILVTSDMYMVFDPTTVTSGSTGRVSAFFIRVR